MPEKYTYVTRIREEGEPTYTFAEIKYGKIVAIHKHWVPLEEFRKFFEANCFFIDISNILINDEKPAIGDVIEFNENGYEIVHYKSTYNFIEIKQYKISLLKLERDRQELLPITYNNNMFDCDKTSLMRIDRARQALEDTNTKTIAWTTYDNKIINIGIEDFKGINNELALRSSKLHARYNELKNYINNIKDEKYIDTILKIDWNTNVNMPIETLSQQLLDVKNMES